MSGPRRPVPTMSAAYAGHYYLSRERRRECDTMKVVCNDGTIFECDRFRAVDSGVLLFGEQESRSQGDEAETDEKETEAEEEVEQEAMGFVPVQSVRYVVSDELLRGTRGLQPTAQQAPPSGAPAGSTQMGGGAPGQPTPQGRSTQSQPTGGQSMPRQPGISQTQPSQSGSQHSSEQGPGPQR